MWSFLLPILVRFAIRFGIDWVISHFPGIPDWVKEILAQLRHEKNTATSRGAKRAAKKRAIDNVILRAEQIRR